MKANRRIRLIFQALLFTGGFFSFVWILSWSIEAIFSGPDTSRMEKELGIRIPRHDVDHDHADYMGFDPTYSVRLCFDSVEFESLVAGVRTSRSFDFASPDSFRHKPLQQRIEMISALCRDSVDGFWTEAKNGFFFVAPQLGFGSDPDSLSQWQRSTGTFLTSQRRGQLYVIDCTIDTATRCLTYEKGYF